MRIASERSAFRVAVTSCSHSMRQRSRSLALFRASSPLITPRGHQLVDSARHRTSATCSSSCLIAACPASSLESVLEVDASLGALVVLERHLALQPLHQETRLPWSRLRMGSPAATVSPGWWSVWRTRDASGLVTTNSCSGRTSPGRGERGIDRAALDDRRCGAGHAGGWESPSRGASGSGRAARLPPESIRGGGGAPEQQLTGWDRSVHASASRQARCHLRALCAKRLRRPSRGGVVRFRASPFGTGRRGGTRGAPGGRIVQQNGRERSPPAVRVTICSPRYRIIGMTSPPRIAMKFAVRAREEPSGRPASTSRLAGPLVCSSRPSPACVPKL